MHTRCMKGLCKVHARCIKGSCKVHTSRMEGLALMDMGNGPAAVVSISAKSALNWPDNAMPICCSHSNAMVSYKGGRRGGGHAAGAGRGECCCAQHDARHALHDHNLQHTADLIAGPETAL